jgi:hypothetical protein
MSLSTHLIEAVQIPRLQLLRRAELSPHPIAMGVQQDLQQPGSSILSWHELVERLVRFQVRLLDQIFG